MLNKRISGEKADNRSSFLSTTAHCSTLANFTSTCSPVRIYVCASARTHCASVLSTVRYGKSDQHLSITIQLNLVSVANRLNPFCAFSTTAQPLNLKLYGAVTLL